MAPAIERLSGRDVSAMRKLSAMFAETFEDTDSYASRPPSDEYLQGFLDRTDVIALAAFGETGAAVGGLVAYVLAKFEQERSEVCIYVRCALTARS